MTLHSLETKYISLERDTKPFLSLRLQWITVEVLIHKQRKKWKSWTFPWLLRKHTNNSSKRSQDFLEPYLQLWCSTVNFSVYDPTTRESLGKNGIHWTSQIQKSLRTKETSATAIPKNILMIPKSLGKISRWVTRQKWTSLANFCPFTSAVKLYSQ